MRDSTRERIEVSGICPASLVSRAEGQGPDLVWGHSLMGSMAQEDASGVLGWPDLADIARIIRYDARGHGQSAVSADPQDYCWPQLARDMWQIADHYGVGSAVLGGASMGCATSLHAACQQPERVSGLILVIPPTAWDGRKSSAGNYRRFASVLRWTAGLPLRLLRWVPGTGADAGFKERMIRDTLHLLAKADAAGVQAAMRGAAMSDLPPPEQLRQLTMPTLILAWPDDPVHPLSTAHKLAALLPDNELIISEDAAEPWQWPERVREFLQSRI